MRRTLPWIIVAWMIATPTILAQSTPPPPVPLALPGPGGPPPIAQISPAPDIAMPANLGIQQDNFRFWARAEYLGWWVKNAPVPISLVTGDANNPTQELLNSSQSLGMFSGLRLGMGIWLDPYNNIGLEGSFFALDRRSHGLIASSDGNGSPTLAFPFSNQTPGATGDYLMPITMPGVFAGSVQVASTLQLWGAEANGVLSLVRNGNVEWFGLVGFRYVDLYERLNINTVSANILTDPTTVLIQGDRFRTSNQFYGGQVGSRVFWQVDRLAFDVTGKFAVGATHQTVDIQGVSSQFGPGGVNGTYAGGFFAQPSNIGRVSGNQFSVIPSIELKLHFLITPRLRTFVGYDFMYWSQVARPGNQVDSNINLSQSTIYGTGVLSGPASPGSLFNRTDFWAQGVTFGLELRF